LEKELIKLANNLYDIEMKYEADAILQLLTNLEDGSDDEHPSAGDEEADPTYPLDDLEKIIKNNSNDDDFVYNIADILINHLDEDGLREISEAISEAIE
jgi:hypothetical protein